MSVTNTFFELLWYSYQIILEHLIYFILILVGIIIAFFLWNFPWILKYYTVESYEEKILDGKILIFSDTHLKPGRSLPRKLTNFIIMNNIKYIVVAGDLLDYKHKLNNKELFDVLSKVFLNLKNTDVGKIFYITSTTSHDPRIDGIREIDLGFSKIILIPGVLKLETSVGIIHISHCDYVCRHGAIARMLNSILGKLGKKLYIERLARKAFGVDDNSWVICGHTHIAGIDHSQKIGNPGGWKSKLWVKRADMAIIVDQDIKLIKIK